MVTLTILKIWLFQNTYKAFESGKWKGSYQSYEILFEKSYIDIATHHNMTSVDIETEEQKISFYQETLKKFFS